jgi:predicted DNA-binding transcriptional regulator YafY
LGLLCGPQGWYLVGWCRLRRGVRGFALDRVAAASLTGEAVPDRERELAAELERLAAEPLVM